MKSVLTLMFIMFTVSATGQIDIRQKLIDSLNYLTRIPYIEHIVMSGRDSDNVFWRVVKQNKAIVPYLLNAINDTTPTNASVPNTGGQCAVGDVCYMALQEIIHGIPTFTIAGLIWDDTNGYSAYWYYVRQQGHRDKFKEQLINWYNRNKQNLVWIKNDEYEICDCSGKHPNGGHYELR